MKLIELEPSFLRILDERTDQIQDEIVGADGLMLLCPKCFLTNGGRVGTHRVICWRPHVPQTRNPVPGRWEFQGSSFADLTLIAGSSSIKLPDEDPARPETKGNCGAHFFVRNGEVVNA